MNVNWVLLLHTNINFILSRNKPGVMLVFETSFEILKYDSKEVTHEHSGKIVCQRIFANVAVIFRNQHSKSKSKIVLLAHLCLC